MKNSKLLALAGVTLASAFLLGACGNSQSSSEKVYSYVFTGDPLTLDAQNTQQSSDAEIITQLVDGLMGNDKYGNLVPLVAEDWSVSQDGLTYTYKIRKDAKWYTSEGEEYAPVKAQDFVAGIKHAVDVKSPALYIIQGSIKGLDAYIKGDEKDFANVGVRAVDDQTVEYTLAQPESFWNSKLTMGILSPVNEEFLKSKGENYAKPTDPSSILYNGPFVLTSFASKSEIQLEKSQTYWDKDSVKLDKVKYTYYDGQDVESLLRNFKEGSFTVARLYPTSSNYAAAEKEFKDNIYYSSQDSTVGYMGFNLDRAAYEYTGKADDKAKQDAKKAILNKDFRQAINFGFDRTSFAAQINGKDGAKYILRTSNVAPGFVQIGEKSFGEVADEKLQTLGDEWKDVTTKDGEDKIYSVDKAKAEFAKAKEALQAEGVTFPIHLDVPAVETSTAHVQRMQSFKDSVEKSLGTDNVVIDIQTVSNDAYDSIAQSVAAGNQADYDLMLTGWTPDFEDPSSYLDIFNPNGGGMIKNLGIDADRSQDAIAKIGLDQYQTLLDDANKETSDVKVRYEKYAAVQAWLTDNSITLPVHSLGGAPGLRKTVPFANSFGYVGNKGIDYLKYQDIQEDTVTVKQYQEAREKWLKEKAESNAKAQEELAKHVK